MAKRKNRGKELSMATGEKVKTIILIILLILSLVAVAICFGQYGTSVYGTDKYGQAAGNGGPDNSVYKRPYYYYRG